MTAGGLRAELIALHRSQRAHGLSKFNVNKPRLTVSEAAQSLGISKSWLDKLRESGAGPAFIRLGRRVVYDARDLEEWAAAHRVIK